VPAAVLPETPLAPFVQFVPRDPRVQVHYSLIAATAAAEVSPDATLYDKRGIRLTLTGAGVARQLEAHGDPQPVWVQRRLLAELRAVTAVHAAPDGSIPDDIGRALDWLELAPALEYAVNALGLAEVDSAIRTDSGRCNPSCTWWQKAFWGSPPCCPW
jgi:hypothetical protein